MSWFERYGLVGSFALILLLSPFYINGYITISSLTDKGFVTFLVACILPIGYILNVVSQIRYYWGWGEEQIHKSIEDSLSVDERNNLQLSCCDSEEDVETKLTAAFRLSKYSDCYVRLADFGTRRWGVFSVNSAIMLVTRVSMLEYIPVKWWRTGRIFDFFPDGIFFLVVVILMIILRLSNEILGGHLKDINRSIINHYFSHSQEDDK